MAKEIKEFRIEKKKKFNEWFNEIVKRAELIDQDYGAKGFVVRRPMTMLIIEVVRNFYENEYKRTGHLPMQFPTVVPEKNFYVEQDHVEGFAPEVFWVSEAGSGGRKLEERLALKPTGETAIYPSYSKWIRSHRDLPLKLYQFGTVFRYETKMTKPFLREREFVWFESHNVYATKKEMQNQIREDMEMSTNIVTGKLAIPFLYMKRPQWDKFAGAVNTYTADIPLPNGKSLQIGSTHELGQNFSKAFEIKFTDKDEKEKTAWQTCWGPGISRQIAAIVAIHGDDKGLILPFEVAPYQIVIIPILFGKKNEEIMKKGKNLEEKLKDNFRVILDDSEKTPGQKYNHWELFGASLRIEIGPREIKNKEVTIVRRDSGDKITVKEINLVKTIEKLRTEILNNLRNSAEKQMKEIIVDADNYADLKKLIKSQKMVRVPFCSIKTGESCAEKIKDETTALVRGTSMNEKNKIRSGQKCIGCEKEAKEIVYVAVDY